VHVPTAPLSVDELLALAPALAGHGRYCYSLALAYLDGLAAPGSEPAGSELVRYRKALACLRCAEALQFEAEERIAVHKAWIYARFGDPERAQLLVKDIQTWELDGEKDILERIAARDVPPVDIPPAEHDPSWEAIRSCIAGTSAASLLVLCDPYALTSGWKPNARYFLADASVTGHDLTALGVVEFDLAIGSHDDQRRAQSAGLKCAEWVVIAE
jgi:hypothetical protein